MGQIIYPPGRARTRDGDSPAPAVFLWVRSTERRPMRHHNRSSSAEASSDTWRCRQLADGRGLARAAVDAAISQRLFDRWSRPGSSPQRRRDHDHVERRSSTVLRRGVDLARSGLGRRSRRPGRSRRSELAGWRVREPCVHVGALRPIDEVADLRSVANGCATGPIAKGTRSPGPPDETSAQPARVISGCGA